MSAYTMTRYVRSAFSWDRSASAPRHQRRPSWSDRDELSERRSERRKGSTAMKPAQFPGFQQFFGFRQGETIFADRTRDIRCPRQLEKVSRLFDSELEPVCQRAQMGFPLARLL